jgi:hypothetical protein
LSLHRHIVAAPAWSRPCSESGSVIADTWRAVEVVAVIPSAAGPPAAPCHVVLFPGVRISRLPAGAPVACGIRVDGRGDPVLRGGWAWQRARHDDDGGAKKREFRHAILPSVKVKSQKRTRLVITPLLKSSLHRRCIGGAGPCRMILPLFAGQTKEMFMGAARSSKIRQAWAVRAAQTPFNMVLEARL